MAEYRQAFIGALPASAVLPSPSFTAIARTGCIGFYPTPTAHRIRGVEYHKENSYYSFSYGPASQSGIQKNAQRHFSCLYAMAFALLRYAHRIACLQCGVPPCYTRRFYVAPPREIRLIVNDFGYILIYSFASFLIAALYKGDKKIIAITCYYQ